MEYNEVIDHTINNIDIGGGNTLSVTLDHLPDPPAIGLEVKCSLCNIIIANVHPGGEMVW